MGDVIFKRGYRLSEAAKYIGVSESLLRKGCSQGVLTGHMIPPCHVKKGRKILFLKEDLDAWLDAGRVASGNVLKQSRAQGVGNAN